MNTLQMIEDSLGDVGFEADYDLNVHPEALTKKEKQMAEVLMRVYKIAHGFNQKHSCYGSHEEWREEGRIRNPLFKDTNEK